MGDKETPQAASFLEDDGKNKSSMRIVFILAFIVAALIAAATMVGAYLEKSEVISAGIGLVMSFLGVATAGKVGQAFSEKNAE